MDTVRPRTILRKSTDTFHSRVACPLVFASRESGQTTQLLIDSVVLDVTTFTSRGAPEMGPALRRLEQVPCDGVDHGNEEANHQPLRRAYPAQTFGQATRQAEGRSADGLNSPQHTKYAEDHQADQGERVESEGRRERRRGAVRHPSGCPRTAGSPNRSEARNGQGKPEHQSLRTAR